MHPSFPVLEQQRVNPSSSSSSSSANGTTADPRVDIDFIVSCKAVFLGDTYLSLWYPLTISSHDTISSLDRSRLGLSVKSRYGFKDTVRKSVEPGIRTWTGTGEPGITSAPGHPDKKVTNILNLTTQTWDKFSKFLLTPNFGFNFNPRVMQMRRSQR